MLPIGSALHNCEDKKTTGLHQLLKCSAVCVGRAKNTIKKLFIMHYQEERERQPNTVGLLRRADITVRVAF